MAEHPIIFTGPSVRAILDGRKTQTRRLIKSRTGPPPTHVYGYADGYWCEPGGLVHCPYGEPGDRLWVRETWGTDECVCARAGFRSSLCKFCHGADLVAYRADTKPPHGSGWRSPIHMPRWASRLLLEVTDVRVQRLQKISEADARAEGVEPYTGIGPEQRVPGPGFDRCLLADQPHRLPFADLWDEINGKRAPWASNPWVWAITFKRVP